MIEAAETAHSANLRDIIYNEGVPGVGDPAEEYFEASKLTTVGLAWETPGIPALLGSPELQRMSQRAARRYSSRPLLCFDEIQDPKADLLTALRNRRSTEMFDGTHISLAALAGVLEHSYGTYEVHGQPRRNSPSGGALYPLDVFVVPQRVDHLTAGRMYHYDPFRHGLADLGGDVDLTAVHAATLRSEFSSDCAAFLIISASFWRSRFKYAQRALRFCLIESGHLAQNMLLVAEGLGLGSRLFGGFIDDAVNEILPGHNGVDDAALYVVEIGGVGR